MTSKLAWMTQKENPEKEVFIVDFYLLYAFVFRTVSLGTSGLILVKGDTEIMCG